MKASTVHELKQELQQLPVSKLAELCVRLAKFKKENKELLTYLLFEAYDEEAYINSVKEEMDSLMSETNKSSLFFAKKTIRKVLRMANKHIRYIGTKQSEVELLLHFCKGMNDLGISFHKSPVLLNLYNNQLKKAGKTIDTLHEDLQYEYKRELNKLKR